MIVTGKQPSLWRWFLMMFFIALVFVGVLVLGSDQLCYSDTVSRQPLYPGAEIIKTEYSFIRARGFGTTRMTLQTPDDPDTVNEWRRQTNLELLRADRFRGLASTEWMVQPDPDGEGSLFLYFSSCGE